MLAAAGCLSLTDRAAAQSRADRFSPSLSTERPPNFAAAAAYSEATGGIGLFAVQNYRAIFERFAPGRDPDTPHLLASGTKSFSGIVAMFAVQERLLRLDEPVHETIAELRSDPLRSQITVRHLLTLASGLGKAGRGGQPVSYAEAVQVPAVGPPGQQFDYNPVNFQLFGELMRRKLKGERPAAYLRRRLFEPVGINLSQWRTTPDGDEDLPGGAYASADAWVRFGLFVLAGGRWNNRQLLDRALLAQCFMRSATNPAYGLTFWLNAPRNDQRINPINGAGPLDTIFAAGSGGQRLYLFPSLNLAVVRQGVLRRSRGPDRFTDRRFIESLFS